MKKNQVVIYNNKPVGIVTGINNNNVIFVYKSLNNIVEVTANILNVIIIENKKMYLDYCRNELCLTGIKNRKIDYQFNLEEFNLQKGKNKIVIRHG